MVHKGTFLVSFFPPHTAEQVSPMRNTCRPLQYHRRRIQLSQDKGRGEVSNRDPFCGSGLVTRTRLLNSQNCEFAKSGHVKSGGCVSGCSDREGVHWNLGVSVQLSPTRGVPAGGQLNCADDSTFIFPDKYCVVVRLSVSRRNCPHVAPRISGSWSRWCSTTCRLTLTEK